MGNSKFTLYLGLNDKDTKTQKISTIEAYKIVSNMVAARFGGGTIFEALGVYKHSDESAALVTETTLRIELLFTDRANVLEFCEQLKVVFNQESIAIQYERAESELI